MFKPIFKRGDKLEPYVIVGDKEFPLWRESCRYVFKVDYKGKKYVVKCDGLHLEQNRAEVDRYYKMPSHDRRFVPKIFGHGEDSESGRYYIIQEFIDLDEKAKVTPRNNIFLEYLIKKYDLTDLKHKPYSISHDKKWYEYGNYGVDKQGNLKIVDFAI